MYLTLLGLGLIVFLLSALGCWLIVHKKLNWVAQDHANHRSMHQKSIPRAGGIPIFISFVLVMGLTNSITEQVHLLTGLGFLLVLLISLVDDYKDTSFFIRLIIHFIAIGFLVWNFYQQLPEQAFGIAMPSLAVFVLLLVAGVWFVNLFNFMDGMDGFAASMTMVACVVFAWVANNEGQFVYLQWVIVLAAAVLGFMLFNKPPAKLFLGDVGSVGIAFTLIFFVLWGLQSGLFSIIFILILFLPFWLDASVVLLLRVFRGEAFWQAHKQHYYQKLARSIGTTKTLWFELLFMLSCAGSALLVRQQSMAVQLLVLLLIISLLFCLYFVVLRHIFLRNQGQ